MTASKQTALDQRLDAFIIEHQLPASFRQTAARLHQPLAERLLDCRQTLQRPCLIGLCGPQGSGKSTAAALLRALLSESGLNLAILSIDDFYLTRAKRLALAKAVHPLLETRGPPGTHDLELCEQVVQRLLSGHSLPLPGFDKAVDDRRPQRLWTNFDGPADVVLLEGWCVGARPQGPADLEPPINALERERDPDGVWRRYVNDALATYQRLFMRLDLLVQLRPASFDVVVGWRREQEARLRTASRGRAGLRLMSDPEIDRFVQHYERLTKHMLTEMPNRAHVVIKLGQGRDFEPGPNARQSAERGVPGR